MYGIIGLYDKCRNQKKTRHGGEMTRNLDSARLMKLLERFLGSTPPPPDEEKDSSKDTAAAGQGSEAV